MFQTRAYNVITILVTTWAIVAIDITHAWLPREADEPMAYVLLCCGIFFFCEVALMSTIVAPKRYRWSFFFWLDVIGTISLIPDIMGLFADSQGDAAVDSGSVAR